MSSKYYLFNLTSSFSSESPPFQLNLIALIIVPTQPHFFNKKSRRYGAQPPLELVRQWFAQGGWFDRKTLESNQIVDILFTASMGLGRAPLSNRLLRHFSLVYLNEMQEAVLSQIVTKILSWGFEDYVDKVKFQI